MSKPRWLDRYRGTRSLVWEDVDVRVYGDAAVAVGVHDQHTEINGMPIGRRCRTTLVAVRDGGWVLVGMQLSPLRG